MIGNSVARRILGISLAMGAALPNAAQAVPIGLVKVAEVQEISMATCGQNLHTSTNNAPTARDVVPDDIVATAFENIPGVGLDVDSVFFKGIDGNKDKLLSSLTTKAGGQLILEGTIDGGPTTNLLTATFQPGTIDYTKSGGTIKSGLFEMELNIQTGYLSTIFSQLFVQIDTGLFSFFNGKDFKAINGSLYLYGRHSGGTDVPEPASAGLLAAGLAAFGRRRKKKPDKNTDLQTHRGTELTLLRLFKHFLVRPPACGK